MFEEHIKLAFQQYVYVVRTGQLSLDGLRRIINYDVASGWSNSPGSLGRQAALQVFNRGFAQAAKEYDEPGDAVYGNNYPLPLKFKQDN